MTTLRVELGKRGYDIVIGRGLLGEAHKFFDLNRKVFIVTDSGVPAEYAERISKCAKDATVVTVPMGEGAKSMKYYAELLDEMVKFGMTRTDCAVAVGGGVVGDLTGFAAASYMRGIDFYNVPTTLLSEVDSSIGGKVAINLGGIKNIVGAFHQPRGVLIDPDTLKTLPKRHISNGLSEAIKMSLTSDKELFELFERESVNEKNIEDIIIRSLKIKKAVVEADERESGIRRILNFGHTLGHGIEAMELEGGLYHGECVAIGMTAVCSAETKKRLTAVLKKHELPTAYSGDIEKALGFISHDKKCEGDFVSAIFVDTPGSFRIEKMTTDKFTETVRENLKS